MGFKKWVKTWTPLIAVLIALGALGVSIYAVHLNKESTEHVKIYNRLVILDTKIERGEGSIHLWQTYGEDTSYLDGYLSRAKSLRRQAQKAWNNNHYNIADKHISEAYTVLDEIPPPPPLPSPKPGFSDTSVIVNDDGIFIVSVTAMSEDGYIELTIDKGTTAKTKEDLPLSEISIIEMAEPPAPPAGTNLIGLTYDIGPDGATFEPPITITFTYDKANIPEGVDEEDMVVAFWDEDADEWVVLEGVTVDPVTNTISTPISHFTAFTVLAFILLAPAVNWWLIVGTIVSTAIIVGVVLWLIAFRRQSDE